MILTSQFQKTPLMPHGKTKTVIIVGVTLMVGGVMYFLIPTLFSVSYDAQIPLAPAGSLPSAVAAPTPEALPAPVVFVPTHVETPESVRALYMSSWVAGTPSIRSKIVTLADQTEINSIMIDIKDATGKISFLTHDQTLTDLGSPENRIADLDSFIQMLHEKHIYVIGRIAVFQDPYMTKKHSDWAIKKKSDGTVWKDFKGLSFLDPSNEHVWDYTIAIANESYAHGFDEINFDYIRFPSDGKISDISYPNEGGTVTRADIIKSFFSYAHGKLKDTGMVRSADLFGLVTTSTDDLGIGQVLENALPYFDYIAPMVYPSHFANGWNNFKNPAEHPYEVIKISMARAVERAKAMGEDPLKLRPWLQDFDIGATYTAAMVKDQIKATYDVGLTSWMIWDAANTYTPGAFLTNAENTTQSAAVN